MGHAKYIGRVGALAVAMGVATAVATPAIGFAAPTDSSSSTSTSSSSESTSSQDSATAPSDDTSAAENTSPSSDSDSDADDDDTDLDTDLDTDDTDDVDDTDLDADLDADTDADTDDVDDVDDLDDTDEGDTDGAGDTDAGDTDADATEDTTPEALARASARSATPAGLSARVSTLVDTVEQAVSNAVDTAHESLTDALTDIADLKDTATEHLSTTTEVSVAAAAITDTPAPTDTTPEAAAITIDPIATAQDEPGPIARIVSDIVDWALAPWVGSSLPGAPASPSSPLLWTLAAWVRREIADIRENVFGLSANAVANQATPTLVLNGYDVVALTTEEVVAFYGQNVSGPAVVNSIQGVQTFELVDPSTGETIGTFDALKSNSPVGLFGNETVLLVTATDGNPVGTAPGELPPVNSIIANYDLGLFAISYSAMPAGELGRAGDAVSLKLLTPLGDIRIPMAFNAAAGLDDHTADNRPIVLTDGYSIAPEDPDAEVYTAITGRPPIYIAFQGEQVFGVYDPDGNQVGRFMGFSTPTSDIFGVYTDAILVTDTLDSINVGTESGQVPPVGSVYTVMYAFNDNTYSLYYSLPSESGDVIVWDFVTPLGTLPLGSTFNASAPSPLDSLSVPGGYSFVPSSPRQFIAINGLPPSEVNFQSYQQFDVYDSEGVQVGSFDADVYSQQNIDRGFQFTTPLDSNEGLYGEAIVVTNVTAGDGEDGVPPVGSVFDFTLLGERGFGTFYSAIPTPEGDVVTKKLVTPFGWDIPLPTRYNAAAGFKGRSFFNPFLP